MDPLSTYLRISSYKGDEDKDRSPKDKDNEDVDKLSYEQIRAFNLYSRDTN